jgi:tRNA modification GTPase
MHSFTDTIAAQATPAGYSALGILRLSGSDAITIVSSHFSGKSVLANLKSHKASFGTFLDSDGRALDEVVCLVYRKPHSYTGEDMVEICSHGNPQIMSRILSVLLQSCRMAEPGEFTQRAFLNGKLDLSRAEAVNDLIHARSSKAESAALMQLKGYLGRYLQELGQRLTELRIKLELMIDFGDQDLPQIEEQKLQTELEELLKDMEDLHSEGSTGRFIRDGVRLCLAGAPNAGKSSIFNAFLNQNRAIVTPHPGTTRDYLEETVSLAGYALIIYDTAGIRDTDSEIELIGIGRTHELIKESDLLLYLIDFSELGNVLPELPADILVKTIFVASKIDLGSYEQMPTIEEFMENKNHKYPLVPCSTLLPEGLSEVKKAILSRLNLPLELEERPLITNTRHLAALERALAAAHSAQQAMQDGLGYEFIAFDLIEARSAIDEIIGAVSTEEMLESIFANFCIGK